MMEQLGLYDTDVVKKTALSLKNRDGISSEEEKEEAIDEELSEDTDPSDYITQDDSMSGEQPSSNVQQMQIVDGKGNIVDFTTLLGEESK